MLGRVELLDRDNLLLLLDLPSVAPLLPDNEAQEVVLDLCANVERYLLGEQAEINNDDRVLLFVGDDDDGGWFDRRREIWRGQVMARLQAAVIAGMETFDAEGVWRASEVHARGRKIDRRVGWALVLQGDGTVLRRYENAHIDAVLLAAASGLVADWWPDLRRCKYDDCCAWFLPRDERQLYHKPACRHRNFAHTRAPHDYAEEHARRIEKTKGRGPANKLRKKQVKKKAEGGMK